MIIRLGPKSSGKCPCERHTEERHRQEEEAPREDRGRYQRCAAAARGCLEHLEAGRGRSSRASGRNLALLTPSFQTFGLPNCEKINVLVLRHLLYGNLL